MRANPGRRDRGRPKRRHLYLQRIDRGWYREALDFFKVLDMQVAETIRSPTAAPSRFPLSTPAL